LNIFADFSNKNVEKYKTLKTQKRVICILNHVSSRFVVLPWRLASPGQSSLTYAMLGYTTQINIQVLYHAKSVNFNILST